MDHTKLLEQNMTLPEGFSAGFAREAVNPLPGTALGGWATASKRLSEEVLDDIMLTCTALSDGATVFLFYSVDVLYVRNTMLDQATERIGEKFGIPPENVVMNATHSHSAPILHYPKMPGMPEYMERFWAAFDRITEEAILDLTRAELRIGWSYTKNLNFVRRYVSVDGTKYLGGSALPKGQDPAEVRHETEADNELQVIRLAREGKKDIMMVNWQCHPCSYPVGTEKGTKVSADWVGYLRQEAEAITDAHVVYHQGCAGNIANGSKLQGVESIADYREKGCAVAQFAKEAFDAAVPVKTGPFRARRDNFIATHNERYKEKEKVGDTDSLYLNTLTIGDVAFVTTPCEWHDSCGQMVKGISPFEMTFVCAYSNGVVSYIPSAPAFDNGGYETKMCHFVRGTGEALAFRLLEMLSTL